MTDSLRNELATLAAALRAYVEGQHEQGGVSAWPAVPEDWTGWQRDVLSIDDIQWDGEQRAPTKTRVPSEGSPSERLSAFLGADTTTSRASTGTAASTAKAPAQQAGLFVELLEEVRPTPLREIPQVERPASLDAVREVLGDCQRCKLCETRNKIVFGVGNPRARLVIVGEAPGADEDAQGEPFVGRAGKLLDKILQAMGLHRSQIYITNILKCRPPGNRNPHREEIDRCEPFLVQQLEVIQPEVMITLGGYASQTLLGVKTPISQLRGTWQEFRGVAVMPTLHPAFLLRQPSAKRLVWDDVQQVMTRLGLKTTR